MAWLETLQSNLPPLTFYLIVMLVATMVFFVVARLIYRMAPGLGRRVASFRNGPDSMTSPQPAAEGTAAIDAPVADPARVGPEMNANPSTDAAPHGETLSAAGDRPQPTFVKSPLAQLPPSDADMAIYTTPRLTKRPTMGKWTTQDLS